MIFVKGGAGDTRHPRMQALIDRAQADLVRRRFDTPADLLAGLYAALVEYLEGRELLRWGPFDAAPCTDATFDDLDHDRMTAFIGTARRARQFPLADDAPPEALLEHLNLLNRGRLTNAAVLLFGKRPQRFLISSGVKCAHFHGTRVGKPIPSHQVYQGTVFELVDHAVDFVLSKIALSVGTRAESVQAPVSYEIPKEVVIEAIVNAVAHRDYTSAASVQVMLFADRLEVWNPGGLPPPLTLDRLRVPHESVPGNPLLARAMYLIKYIEQMGTGTLDMIERCVAAGLREPEFEAAGEFVTRIRRAAPAGQPVVFTDKNMVRNRSGSARQELKGAALSRFLLRKRGLRWDGVPVPHARLEDLSEAAVDRFRNEARRSGRVDAALLVEPTPTLVDRLHLRERSHLKRAALLLFHPDPEVFFTGAYVKIGFFRDNVDLLYHDEIHGDLFTQVARTIDLLSTKYLRAGIRYEGIRRVESFPVPRNALREAVLNAVVHKDYASGATIQIRVYDDKLMIWNPGQLPPDWKAEDLLEKHESKPFNPDVAHAFFRAGLVEAWGRGIDLILADCRQAGVPAPELRFERAGFWAVFRFPADYPVPTGAPRTGGERMDSAEPAGKPAELEAPTGQPISLRSGPGPAAADGYAARRARQRQVEDLLEGAVVDSVDGEGGARAGRVLGGFEDEDQAVAERGRIVEVERVDEPLAVELAQDVGVAAGVVAEQGPVSVVVAVGQPVLRREDRAVPTEEIPVLQHELVGALATAVPEGGGLVAGPGADEILELGPAFGLIPLPAVDGQDGAGDERQRHEGPHRLPPGVAPTLREPPGWPSGGRARRAARAPDA